LDIIQNQSEIAIGSGGWLGRGFSEGTQTKGELNNNTDYIFTTVGEDGCNQFYLLPI
jgi:rod shape determining protein RodA